MLGYVGRNDGDKGPALRDSSRRPLRDLISSKTRLGSTSINKVTTCHSPIERKTTAVSVPTRANSHLLTGLLLIEGVDVIVMGPSFPPARFAFALPEVGSPGVTPLSNGPLRFTACDMELAPSSRQFSPRGGAAGPRNLPAMSTKGAMPRGTLAGEGISL